MIAKDWIINFDGLVKNRCGPYRIVLVNKDGQYWNTNYYWTNDISNAKDYSSSSSIGPVFSSNNSYETYLTTAAGLIKLAKKDCIIQ